MKKILSGLCCAAMLLSLIACSSGTADQSQAPSKAPDDQTPASQPAEDQTPASSVEQTTFEELLESGKANGNKLTIYSTHSVTVSAVEAFANKFGIDIDLVEGTQIGDNNQITQVATEVSSGVSGADIIFIQDGARTVSELVDEGYVYNWYNQEILDKVGADC